MIRLEAYSSGTTPVVDPRDELRLASDIRFTTFYPGGIHGTLHCKVPRRVVEWWDLNGAQRLVAREGLEIAWEGRIDNFRNALAAEGESVEITATGWWGCLAMRRRLNKPWADKRLDNTAWTDRPNSGHWHKFQTDHNNRLYFQPRQGVEYAVNDVAYLRYDVPTLQTIKRVTFDYDLQPEALMQARAVFYFQSPSTYNNSANLYDGLTSTTAAATWITTDYFYIGFSEQQRPSVGMVGFYITSGGNTNASVLSCEYWDSAAWTALTISDGTAVAGKTMAQTGNVTFTLPGDITETEISNKRFLWLRFKVSANLTAVTWGEMFVGQAQSWNLVLYNVSTSGVIWSTNTKGSGSRDETLATPAGALYFYFSGGAKQVGVGNGTVYGKITNLVVYTETGSINLTEIAKDAVSVVADIHTTNWYVGSNTLSLVPFITDGYDRIGDILLKAAGYGDASYNPWACYLDHSERAPIPDGKPPLVVEAQPLTSAGYDYTVRFAELDPSAGDVSYETDYSAIVNWVIAQYQDSGTGAALYQTPDDDATLKDTTSITKYGQQEAVVEVNTTDSAKAIQYGRRYLGQYKDPVVRMSSPIVIAGMVETSSGNSLPVSMVRAGKRLRISDFLGTDVVIFIASTEYQDGKVTIYAGDGGLLT